MDEALESRILDTLYRGVVDADALKQALELIADSYACPSAAFIAFDRHEPGASFTTVIGVFGEAAVQKRHLEYAAVDPAPAIFALLPVGRASTTNRLMPDDVRKRSQFANEFYHPLGLVETLGGNLFSERGRTALIGLHRDGKRDDFTDTEIDEIERLSPHLRRVMQLRRQFAQLETKNTALETALDRLPAGLALIGTDGAALFVNRAMRDMARRADGFVLTAGGMPTPVQNEARRRFRHLLNDAMNGGAGGALSVPSSRSDRPYAMLVSRAPPTAAAAAGMPGRRAAVLVIVHDPDSRAPPHTEILRHTLGLPEGAARLALALAGDEDLKSFAERQGVTIHTARFHLRTALARTGARTQSELVRVVMRMLGDFAIGRGEERK